MHFMSDCVYQEECKNYGKSCPRCFNFHLYAPVKERKGLNSRSATNKQKKAGMDFENRGTRQYNQAVRVAKDAAHRQIASGAISHLLGDMITQEQLTASLAEFKERGSKDAKGEKQITIKREWLEKLKQEARQMGRDYYFLPFTFTGSDTDYVAMDYNMLLSYIQTIHTLLERIRLLELQLEADNE